MNLNSSNAKHLFLPEDGGENFSMPERGASFFGKSNRHASISGVNRRDKHVSRGEEGGGRGKSREGFFKLMAYWKSFLQRPLNSQCVRYDNYMMLIFGTFSVSESSAPKKLILFSLREEFVAGRLLYLTLLFRIHFISHDALLMLLQIFF